MEGEGVGEESAGWAVGKRRDTGSEEREGWIQLRMGGQGMAVRCCVLYNVAG